MSQHETASFVFIVSPPDGLNFCLRLYFLYGLSFTSEKRPAFCLGGYSTQVMMKLSTRVQTFCHQYYSC